MANTIPQRRVGLDSANYWFRIWKAEQKAMEHMTEAEKIAYMAAKASFS